LGVCLQVVQGNKMMEGAGVRICRTLGSSQLRNLDPFLMLVRALHPEPSGNSYQKQECSTSGKALNRVR
jgi:hypothetical protein